MAARCSAERVGIDELDGCAASDQQLARRCDAGRARDGPLMCRLAEKNKQMDSLSCTVLVTSISFLHGSKALSARTVDVWDGSECEPGRAGVCAASRGLGRKSAYVRRRCLYVVEPVV